MKNLFNNVLIFSDDVTYQTGQRVIYNHELYISNIDDNNSLPSTGNDSVDNILSSEYSKGVNSSSWNKI